MKMFNNRLPIENEDRKKFGPIQVMSDGILCFGECSEELWEKCIAHFTETGHFNKFVNKEHEALMQNFLFQKSLIREGGAEGRDVSFHRTELKKIIKIAEENGYKLD
jgi:hypothetical protein